ncbi:MAG: NfeD family protein [Bdellovibrionota bacterium]
MRITPVAALISSLLALPAIGASEKPGEVRVLSIDGIINPVTSRYVRRELEDANRAHASAVILTIDSPGGLESAMREIVQSELGSSVPVVTYVSPPGARAASAGMFIAMAGHIAAMAPGTNIGAAHPVTLGKDRAGAAMEEKVLNDAAALGRSIADERGRNGAWVEKAIRQSVAITSNEARRIGVIDLRADNLSDLLGKLKGKIRTQGASIVRRPMTLPERILQTLTDPNIAYILLTIGFIGIIAEFYHPGMIFPGSVGVLSLLLGYVALGSLPLNAIGLLLLLLGLGLLIAELHFPTVGALGGSGLAAFILGSLMLYRPLHPLSPAMPRVEVSPWVLGGASLLLAGFFFGVLRAALAARHRPVVTGPEALIGAVGLVEADLKPKGIVNLRGERWTAEVVPPGLRVRSGKPVEVLEIKGVTLKVRPKL